jgi:glycosyltransferase involved in cell wall biosynthesis
MHRILFLLRSFNIGGAERQLILLASALQDQGYSVKIAIFYSGGPLEVEVKKRGIEVINLQRKGRLDFRSFFFRLTSLIRHNKPDILHSYLPVANIWAALVKILLPETIVVWGVRASSLDLKQYNWQTQFTEFIEIQLSRFPDWIICNSQAGLLNSLKKGYPKARMSVISNGIDTNRFFPDRERGLHLRKYYNIENDQKVIGMVARIDPMKDYPNFLHAAALLLKEKPNIHFLCVGDGPQKLIHEYKQMASSLGLENAVTWVGYQENMFAVYNALDILVSASAYGEGFSNVVGEAMACGVPCVATNIGDSALLVEEFGELVPPSNPQALRDGILNLLRIISQRDSFGANQLAQRVTREFSVDALASNTIRLFEMLVNPDNEATLKNI